MGSNNNKNQQQPQQQQNTGYGPNPGVSSSNDPKGRMQNQIGYQQQRYESQQGPVADSMAYNYGRGSEADFGDRTDIMNQYRDIASGGGSSGGGGGGGGFGGSFNTYTVSPERASTERASAGMVGPARQLSVDKLNPLERVNAQRMNPQERVSAGNPYQSYEGFQEFGKTGGYSAGDMSNLRARGTAPIRAAYGNAERALGQQRSLQGGYSPNSVAAQVKMAREQGQSMADASQNVEAGIVADRNKGRISGYQGMADIERARQLADLDAAKFNSQEGRLINQQDISNMIDTGKFNSEQGRLGNQFDIENQFNTGKFNIGNELDVDKTNVGNQMDVSKYNAGQGNSMNQFNADLNYRGQVYNADAYSQTQNQQNAAGQANASRAAASAAQNNDDRLRALAGMSNLYGTTPGMSQLFGNQVSNMVGQGGTMGLGYINAENQAGQQPGQYEQTKGRINDMLGYAGAAANVGSAFLNNRNQSQTQQRQPNYGIPTNNQFNPGNYGYSTQLGTPPPFNSYGQTYDEG